MLSQRNPAELSQGAVVNIATTDGAAHLSISDTSVRYERQEKVSRMHYFYCDIRRVPTTNRHREFATAAFEDALTHPGCLWHRQLHPRRIPNQFGKLQRKSVTLFQERAWVVCLRQEVHVQLTGFARRYGCAVSWDLKARNVPVRGGQFCQRHRRQVGPGDPCHVNGLLSPAHKRCIIPLPHILAADADTTTALCLNQELGHTGLSKRPPHPPYRQISSNLVNYPHQRWPMLAKQASPD